MFFPSREMCLHPSWQSSRHLSPSAEFSGRLAFPHHLWHLVPREISGGVAYVRTDFLEDTLPLLSRFLELARLTTSLDCGYSLGINA